MKAVLFTDVIKSEIYRGLELMNIDVLGRVINASFFYYANLKW